MRERPNLGFGSKLLQRGPLGSYPWVLKESLAWFYLHPLLRRSQERIHFWPWPSGKGFMEMLVANHTPFLGEETSIRRAGFALGLSLGFLVELGWAHSYPFLPSTPPTPSPAALDCCDSRGYDRAVARAKYLLGILEPWISLPRPESSKDKKTNVWGSGLGSHWNCLAFPGESLRTEIGSLSQDLVHR